MSHKNIFIIALSFAFAGITVFGFSADQSAVSLKDCIDIALQNSPELKYSFEDCNRATALYDSKSAEGLPQFYARIWQEKSSDDVRSDGVVANNRWGFFNIGAGIIASYQLYNPTQKSTKEVFSRNIDLARFQEKRVRDEVVLQVKRLYHECVAARKSVELQQKVVRNQEKRFASISAYVRNGDRPVLERSSAEVNLSQAKLDYDKVKNLELLQKSELKASMGVLPDSVDIILSDVPPVVPVLKYTADEIYKFLDNSTSMRIAKINSEVNRSKLVAIRTGHLPRVDLDAFYGYMNENVDPKNNTWSEVKDQGRWSQKVGVGVSAQVSLFNGGKIEAEASAALAEYNKSLYDEHKIAIKFRKDATNGVAKLTELKQQIEISKLNIENARVNLNLAQRSYDSGIGSLLVVQTAEMSLLQTEMNFVTAKKEYFQTLAMIANLIGVEEEVLCGK